MEKLEILVLKNGKFYKIISEERVRERAYEYWVQEGKPKEKGEEHYQTALGDFKDYIIVPEERFREMREGGWKERYEEIRERGRKYWEGRKEYCQEICQEIREIIEESIRDKLYRGLEKGLEGLDKAKERWDNFRSAWGGFF